MKKPGLVDGKSALKIGPLGCINLMELLTFKGPASEKQVRLDLHGYFSKELRSFGGRIEYVEKDGSIGINSVLAKKIGEESASIPLSGNEWAVLKSVMLMPDRPVGIFETWDDHVLAQIKARENSPAPTA